MNNKTDSFLNNECMKAIVELSKKYPNNMELGSHVRAFINDVNITKNQVTLESPDVYVDDERSFLGRKRDDE